MFFEPFAMFKERILGKNLLVTGQTEGTLNLVRQLVGEGFSRFALSCTLNVPRFHVREFNNV